MDELLRLAIKDEETLKQAGDHLHDGNFDPAEVKYDPATSTFTLTVWREIDSHQWLWIADTPDTWARCRLTLRQVEGADIVVREEGLWSLFVEFEYKPTSRTLSLLMAMNVWITLRVAALDGELEDTGEIKTDRKQRVSSS